MATAMEVSFALNNQSIELTKKSAIEKKSIAHSYKLNVSKGDSASETFNL